jgi:hypothetical protein
LTEGIAASGWFAAGWFFCFPFADLPAGPLDAPARLHRMQAQVLGP